jgi:aryl-alcohol dehydrogenase-like predicted oxidoreductase
MSSICFGCEPLGGTDWGDVDVESIKNAIHTALDLGINFFDTAGVYGLGLSEERLSKILGNRRHDMVIATKGGLSWEKSRSGGRAVVVKDSSPSAIRRDAEDSLRRLRLETLPIFFVHWPDGDTPIEDTFFELLQLKNEGKIQSIGCSNFSAQQVKQAINVSQVDYMQAPVNILNGPLEQNISDICTKNEIKVIAYNVLANGLLAGKYNKNSSFPENDRRSRLSLFKGIEFHEALDRVEELKVKATEKNSSVLQYVINWTLKQENISAVILGIKNSKQIEDNWSAII